MPFCPRCAEEFFGQYCPQHGERLIEQAPRSDRAGEVLENRYRLLQRVDAGAMGEVYRAEMLVLARPVAVKLLLPAVARNADAVKRLRREALSTSSLDHPNIVRVTDFGHAGDGSVFLVMEWLEGESLAARMQRGPVELPLALTLMAQAAEGLAAAHDRGVIHRDVKPSNLFLATGHDGGRRLVVLDFGIAKLADAESQLTREGMFLGTPDYVSPEQAGLATPSEVAPVDARTDIYSLGVVLYELLAGEVPFSGESYQAVLLARAEAPEPPSSRAPERGIPAQVDRLVAKCMALRPEHRFESARTLAGVLRDIATGTEVSAEVLRPAEDSSAWATDDGSAHSEPPPLIPVRRTPWLALLVLVGALAASVVWLVRSTHSAEGDPQASAPTGTTDAGAAADAGSDSFQRTVATGALEYRVRVSPSPAQVGQPLRIEVAVDGTERALARVTEARVTLEHYLQHRRVLEAVTPVRDRRLTVALTPPREGKYHVTLELLQAQEVVDTARFDVCIGAVPDSARAEEVCPRMN